MTNEQVSGYPYTLSMAVRDYECDMQGIVNNAVYQNYFEHARHELIKTPAFNFVQAIADGLFLVVRRAEVDYLKPLRSGDTFTVYSRIEQVSKLRYAFRQKIIRAADQAITTEAYILVTGTDSRGKPGLPPNVMAKLAALSMPAERISPK